MVLVHVPEFELQQDGTCLARDLPMLRVTSNLAIGVSANGPGWNVTHINSGKSCANGWTLSMDQAVELAEALQSFECWEALAPTIPQAAKDARSALQVKFEQQNSWIHND